ncbi:AAA family ATPase [Vreelandella glaciei]|uniref:AAA family ATPase n=1 Tax=Vreelandella glaciei TaxID=186761 RepID=UPI003001C573
MKFLKLYIVSKGKNGLETESLVFGNHITQLYGPTGTGKTPLVKSIAYCLGYSVKFRQEIYNRCESANLIFKISEGEYSVKRFFLKSKKIEVEVTDPHGGLHSFYDEESYSNYLFDLLGVNNRELISKSGTNIGGYMSTVLPLFYVTQDEGYSSVYKYEGSFIKDQFSEMVRLSYSLPEKNSFNVKKNQIHAKQKLDSLDLMVSEKNNRLRILKETVVSNRKSYELQEEIKTLEAELDRIGSSAIDSEDVITAIDQMLNAKKKRARDVLNEINTVKNRRHGLIKIKGDIETEINTLSLNEEARRVFMSFGEVCSSAGCQLFSRSSDSYAKNLLYLKDQIKDLESNDNYSDNIELKLSEELKIIDEVVAELENEKQILIDSSEWSAGFKIISDIKIELFKLHSELFDVKKIEVSEAEYINTLNRREEALNAYEAYKTGGKVDLRLSEFRKKLRLSFIDWLGELETSNISHDITFKDDFEPVLGNESVNQLSGSTGSRTVLAFHAALLEIAADSSPFKFLILDAPKQHETENVDLNRYMLKLKYICKKYDVQVIFSATEYEYKGDSEDEVWVPNYYEGKKKMFMRKPL